MRNYRVRHPFSLADEGATPGGLLQLSRLALVVGALTILVGVGVGYYSYRVSRDALLETLYESNFRLAKSLALQADSYGADMLPSDLVELLRRNWEEGAGAAAIDRHLCVIGPDAIVSFHSDRPQDVGSQVGASILKGATGETLTLGELARSRGEWSGTCVAGQDPGVVGGFAYSSRLDALVTVLVPSATVAGRVRAIALPWVAGVAAITLVLLPIAMALLHRAYTVARRGSMRANDELRQEIAKRERDQEELRRLASFPELNPNAVVETDPDGQLHYLNPGVRRMMPDLAASGLDHPFMAQMAKIAEELRDSVTTTYGPQAVMRIVRVDDRWFHQIIYSVDASTQSSRLRIYAFDVTEQADSERKLRAAHQELQEAHARQARQVRELQGRDRLVRLQMQGTSVARARTEILEVMSHALGLRQVVFYEPSADGEGLEATASLTGEGLASESGAEASMPFLSLHCEDNLAVQSYVEQQPRCSDRRDEAAVPIVFGDTVLGVVWTGDAEGEGRLDEVAPYTMWRLGQQAALLLRMARVTEGLEDGAFCVAELLALE